MRLPSDMDTLGTSITTRSSAKGIIEEAGSSEKKPNKKILKVK